MLMLVWFFLFSFFALTSFLSSGGAFVFLVGAATALLLWPGSCCCQCRCC